MTHLRFKRLVHYVGSAVIWDVFEGRAHAVGHPLLVAIWRRHMTPLRGIAARPMRERKTAP